MSGIANASTTSTTRTMTLRTARLHGRGRRNGGPAYQLGSFTGQKTSRVARIRWPLWPAAIRLAAYTNLRTEVAENTQSSKTNFGRTIKMWQSVGQERGLVSNGLLHEASCLSQEEHPKAPDLM